MLLLLLQLISFNVFAQELESLHKLTPLHPPANAPLHHHHNRNLSPISAHTPLHPSHHAKPPTHHLRQHPPAHAPVHHHKPRHPVKPPTHQHPPAHALVQPLFHVPIPIKSRIAVEGAVYVKSCKHAGVDTLLNATSLNGAIVKLQCNNTKRNVVRKGETDKNGYFHIKGPKDISSFAAHNCNVVLSTAPNGLKPSNLHGGITGALLKQERKKSFVSNGHVFILYNVKPLAFEPKCTH